MIKFCKAILPILLLITIGSTSLGAISEGNPFDTKVLAVASMFMWVEYVFVPKIPEELKMFAWPVRVVLMGSIFVTAFPE